MVQLLQMVREVPVIKKKHKIMFGGKQADVQIYRYSSLKLHYMDKHNIEAEQESKQLR